MSGAGESLVHVCRGCGLASTPEGAAGDGGDTVGVKLDIAPQSGAWQYAMAIRKFAHHHRDPFDRMLIAQAISEPLRLITGDARLCAYSSEGATLQHIAFVLTDFQP